MGDLMVAAQNTPRVNLVGMERGAMQDFFTALGERKFRAAQVLKWIYRRGATDFAVMTDLALPLRRRLGEVATLGLPPVSGERTAADGTRKWLLAMSEGAAVETVFIPERGRGTLCVSSQAGCVLNCTFCATARQGFNRNLSSAEIIAQLLIAGQRIEAPQAVTNVVLMGMGEPLLNFDNVAAAVRLMVDDFSFGLSRRRVTLSTAGVVPAIIRLAEECPVSLAVSLHAPEDKLRDQLVPLNRKYPIAALLDACRAYARRRAGAVTFEYVMLDGVNDSPRHAKKLARLLRGMAAKVNLIPFNPFPGIAYRRSPQTVTDAFRDVLLGEGLMTITRRPRGEDIDAACGQLAGRIADRTRRAALARLH